jgi:SAM-dependent methyltransferase
MYKKTAHFYDAIYSFKDYAAEFEMLRGYFEKYGTRQYTSILDVACGTGGHLPYFTSYFETVHGLDLDQGMLAVARDRFPAVTLHQANMVDFALDQTFDVVTCLFSSIGYVQTETNLNAAVASMARHVEPGGLLIIEPWLKPGVIDETRLGMNVVDEDDLKIVRMAHIENIDNISNTKFFYLIGEKDAAGKPHVYYEEELHRLGLFSHEQYAAAYKQAGIPVQYLEPGPTNRGVYIGVKEE